MISYLPLQTQMLNVWHIYLHLVNIPYIECLGNNSYNSPKGFVAFKKKRGVGGFSRVFSAGECRKFRIVNAEKFRTEAYTRPEDSNVYPIGSMYGISTYIYYKSMPNVGKHTIHGSFGYGFLIYIYHPEGSCLTLPNLRMVENGSYLGVQDT